MLKKPITFEDFNGEERTEVHYFNLTKADMAEMELTYGNGEGFVETLKSIARTKDPKLIVATFKDLVRRSYGIRSEDGQKFYKSEEIFKEFEASPAYSALIVEMFSDAKASAIFINGVIPNSLQQSEAQLQETLSRSPEEILAELEKTPEQLARERSEASLQGHQSKHVAEPQRVADPVIQPPAIPQQTFQAPQTPPIPLPEPHPAREEQSYYDSRRNEALTPEQVRQMYPQMAADPQAFRQ